MQRLSKGYTSKAPEGAVLLDYAVLAIFTSFEVFGVV